MSRAVKSRIASVSASDDFTSRDRQKKRHIHADIPIVYVVTKAVSRFGRYAEDVLMAVRALNEYGVEVYFEDQKFGSIVQSVKRHITIQFLPDFTDKMGE